MKRKTKNTRVPKGGRRAQLSLEAMLSFAAYAALVAAFVFAARQASDAATPKIALAQSGIEASAGCLVIEYASLNSRHMLADLPSLEGITASEKTLAKEAGTGATGGTARVFCGAAARSQGIMTVKQNDKEQS